MTKDIKQNQNDMESKIIKKMIRLLESGHQLQMLKSQQYSTQRMKLDRFILAKEQSETSTSIIWDWHIYCDLAKYPILSGDKAESIVDWLLGYHQDLLHKYLEY